MASPPFSVDQLSWLAAHGTDFLGADICGGWDLTEPSAEADEQLPPSSAPEASRATGPPTLGSFGELGEVVWLLITKLGMRGMRFIYFLGLGKFWLAP